MITNGPEATPLDHWVRHTSARWGISFDVPVDWQEIAEDRLGGEDGFVQIAPFTGPGVSVDQACEWEANVQRERYGPKPQLLSLPRDNVVNFKDFPCLILGTEDAASEFESAVVLPNPTGKGRERFLVLGVDTAHAEAVARSLAYHPVVTPWPTLSGNSYLATPRPEDIPADLPLRTAHLGELILEEYAVVEARVDGPGHLEFFQRIPPSVWERRRAWRDAEPPLNPLRPVEVGGRQVTVQEVTDEFRRDGYTDFTIHISVQVEGQEVYRYHMLPHAGVFPLYYLGNWDDRWVVEVNGMLIVDGEIVNQAWGYDEIFSCQLLNGKPFYFGVRDDKTDLVYDGRPLPVEYEWVYHGMCCEPGAFNAAGNERMVWFYALQDDVWYYVELGAYPLP